MVCFKTFALAMKSLVRIFVLSFLYAVAVKAMHTSSQIISDAFEGNLNNEISKTIVVDHYGKGNFNTIQSAIDSIPIGNDKWIRIYIKHGIYNEQIVIPNGKSYILMEGNDPSKTIIQHSGKGDAIGSATFRLYAEFFVAVNIIFKNTFNQDQPYTPYHEIQTAPAVVLVADKAAFFKCQFFSVQDTLGDLVGRHYFQQCYIKGAIDFIWGGGQSIYQSCVIEIMGVISEQLQQEVESETANGGPIPGYITAQGRESEQDTSGFVFNGCSINGVNKAFLGRAYRAYSRVLFCNTNMADVIEPLGWNNGLYKQVDTMTYAEVNCNGPGSDKRGRVPWEKTVSPGDASYFTNPKTFLDVDGWIEALPPHLVFTNSPSPASDENSFG